MELWHDNCQLFFCSTCQLFLTGLDKIASVPLPSRGGRNRRQRSLPRAIMAAMWAVVIGQMCGVLATLLPHDEP